MGKTDGGLRSLFRENMRDGIMWTSVETGMTAGGVPDSNFLTRDGVEGWVEFKQTNKNSVVFQPGQIGWLTRRARYGGRAFVAVRFRHEGGPRKGPPADELRIYGAADAPALQSGGMAAAHPLLQTGGGPARWRWLAVRALLVS